MKLRGIIASVLAMCIVTSGCAAPMGGQTDGEASSFDDEVTTTAAVGSAAAAMSADGDDVAPLGEVDANGLPALGFWAASKLITAAGAQLGSLAFDQLLKETGHDSDRNLLEGMKVDLDEINRGIKDIKKMLVQHMDAAERYHFEQLDARVSARFALIEELNDTLIRFSRGEGNPTEADRHRLATEIVNKVPESIADLRRQIDPSGAGRGVFEAWVVAASNADKVSTNVQYWQNVQAYRSYLTQTMGMGVNLLRQAHGLERSATTEAKLNSAVEYSQAAAAKMQITMGAPLEASASACKWVQLKGDVSLYAGQCLEGKTNRPLVRFGPEKSKATWDALSASYNPSQHGGRSFKAYSQANGLPFWECSVICQMNGSYYQLEVNSLNGGGRATNGSISNVTLKSEALGVPEYKEVLTRGEARDQLAISFDPLIRPDGVAPRGYYGVRFSDPVTGEKIRFQADARNPVQFELPATADAKDRAILMEVVRLAGVEKDELRGVTQTLTFVSGDRPTAVTVTPKL